MRTGDKECSNIYENLDCLTIPDLVVESSIILFFCLPAIVIVIIRLKKMYKRRNFTQEQLWTLKFHKILYWHVLAYVSTFCISLGFAISVFLIIKIGEYSLQDILTKILSKVFWWTLYGYVTLLNLIFTVIAYNFIKVSNDLQHKQTPKFSKYLLQLFWGVQTLSIFAYLGLIWTYQTHQQPDKFKALQYISLAQTAICTLLLVGIFFIIYKKVRKSTTITITVKKRQTRNIIILTILHVLRVGVEVFNIAFSDWICSWRWNNENQKNNLFAIYLGLAHFFINIMPILFILISRSFKPPREEFRTQSIGSLLTNTDII